MLGGTGQHDLSDSRAFSVTWQSVLVVIGMLVTGGLVSLIVALRGRLGFFRNESTSTAETPFHNLVAGIVLLVNVISFDIIRYQVRALATSDFSSTPRKPNRIQFAQGTVVLQLFSATVDFMCITCPAMTLVKVILRALDRHRF